MHKYKMTIAYDGTVYCGWQIQPNGPSIQEKLQEILSVLTKQPAGVTGSGRTDAGVHALGQVAHFEVPLEIDIYRFLNSLNAMLPKNIRVKAIEKVPADFHARYSAVSKTYHYHLSFERFQNPFTRLYCWQFLDKIDQSLIIEAARYFLGTHDFTSFANEAHHGSASRDAVRTMQRLDVVEQEGGVRLEFQADGFLYKMVRNITGTLLEVASGKRPLTDIPHLLKTKDRRQSGMSAPPQGLFLVKVDY
jgi:tRNA pseudouridine38-40 synthase